MPTYLPSAGLALLIMAAPTAAKPQDEPAIPVQQHAFLKACTTTRLIDTRSCACAWRHFKTQLSDQRLSLTVHILADFPLRRPASPPPDKPFCLRVLEQEGPNTYAFMDAFVAILGQIRRTCTPDGDAAP